MAAKSAAEFYAEANSLFVDENYEAALKSYTKAVELDQQNVDFLLKRSACHLKLKHLEGVHLTCGPAASRRRHRHAANSILRCCRGRLRCGEARSRKP